MNAQLNSTEYPGYSTNFQQFVATNKGKNIVFKHTDEKNVSTDIIRYVVDVCADYFTFKYDESDAKIAGFYYYTDCKMVEEKHPLISVLEKHNVSVLNLSIGLSCIFKYSNYCDYDSLINGTCLTTSQPVGFHIDSIKEVWSIVEGEFSKVWEAQQPVAICIQGTDECKAKKVKKQLDPEDGKIKEFLSTHRRGMTVYTKEKVYRDFEYIGVMTAEESTPFSYIIIMGNCDDFQINIPLSDVHLVVRGKDSYERGCKSFFEKPLEKKEPLKNEVKFNVFKENVVEWEALVSEYYFFVGYTPVRSEYLEFQRTLNRVKTEGFSEELYKELVRCSDLLRERLVSRMSCGYNDFILKISRKYAELINKIKKAVGDEPIDDLIEKINKKLETSKKTLQIEYRGKAKTVEVMNEYTHGNGKDYVLVKDITDNGKTKTLFKEYIKYM